MHKGKVAARVDGCKRKSGTRNRPELIYVQPLKRSEFIRAWQTSRNVDEVAAKVRRSVRFCTKKASELRCYFGINLKMFGHETTPIVAKRINAWIKGGCRHAGAN